MPPPLLPHRAGDWVYIQAQYELGEKPVTALAKETGENVQRILAQANRNGWVRSTELQSQKKAELRLAREANELELVEKEKELAVRVNVEMQYQMLGRHRKDVGRALNLTNKLMDELCVQMESSSELYQLGLDNFKPDKTGRDKTNELYQHVVSFAGRVESMKKLAESMKSLVPLERQAYGVYDGVALNGDGENAAGSALNTPVGQAMDEILSRFDAVLTGKKNTLACPPPTTIENEHPSANS